MKKLIFNHIKNLSIATLLIFGYATGSAQEKKHEFAVSVGGVFSSITYDLEGGNVDQGEGIGFGLRYSYYLSENWSIGLGAEYQSYKSAAHLNNFSGAYITTDVENESFEFRYSGSNYNEKQTLRYMNIPLTVQFETSGDDEVRWYIAGGVKAGIAIDAEYETSITNLSTSGYYPQYNTELFDPKFMGFGQFSEVDAGKQSLDTKMSWSGTLETGFKQAVGNRGWAYLGIFVDYGFTKISNDSSKNLIAYPQGVPVNLKYNSVLDTPQAKDTRLIAYGVKFRLAFN